TDPAPRGHLPHVRPGRVHARRRHRRRAPPDRGPRHGSPARRHRGGRGRWRIHRQDPASPRRPGAPAGRQPRLSGHRAAPGPGTGHLGSRHMGAQAHRPPPRIALIDGNSFYCACERVLRPSLEGKPVIVLSNNDGCAIARTAEAKAMGIPMGAPWFSIRHLQARGLVAISANFALYGDMSDRMMRVIGQFSPAQEIYSIDECFLDLTGLPGTGREIGTRIRQRVLRWVGIPTCVGIGATKTLAKLANHLAKSLPRLQGVCDLSGLNHAGLLRAIRHVPVGDVWGVGRRLAPSLEASGIRTAADLARADRHELRRRYSIVLAKTARELCGEPAIGWEDAPSPKQQIMSTRSFGRPVRDLTELEQAVSLFTSRAAEKLRQQHSHASVVQVYI